MLFFSILNFSFMVSVNPQKPNKVTKMEWSTGSGWRDLRINTQTMNNVVSLKFCNFKSYRRKIKTFLSFLDKEKSKINVWILPHWHLRVGNKFEKISNSWGTKEKCLCSQNKLINKVRHSYRTIIKLLLNIIPLSQLKN